MQSNLALKDFVIKLLQDNLPVFYYYHDYEHTLYVMNMAEEIGRYEKCTQAEIDLLCAAALWHDTGFINTYDNHEEESCVLARRYLPAYGNSPGDIDLICGMIMATKVPQSPNNKLEEIIADADLEYLGTDSAALKANNLFLELQHLDPSLTKTAWDKIQVSFLEKHHYFTRFCKVYSQQGKSNYLNCLINGL